MKLNGLMGKGSGKLGSSVFAISGGEQIVRQYNPVVSNPQTDAQVEQRAKLKLMSQVAAALAPAIMIKKQGLKSARNLFIQKNFGLVSFADGKAEIELAPIQLTSGNMGIGDIQVGSRADEAYPCHLNNNVTSFVDKVVWVCVQKTEDEKLLVFSSTIAEKGANNNFAANVSAPDSGCVIYAYGVKFASETAKTKFEDYVAEPGDITAVLEAVKSTSLGAADLTATSGIDVSGE